MKTEFLQRSDNLSVRKMPYFAPLDGIRALAVTIVFIGHARLLPSFPAGFGVTIFFFMSGYLISTLMRIECRSSGEINLKKFYMRRMLRINPPLWIAMVCMAGMYFAGLIPAKMKALVLLGQAFFFVNYLPENDRSAGLPSPLWSLAVEEHFYMLFPILVILMARRFSSGRIAAILALTCLVALLLRAVSALYLDNIENIYYWSHTRYDSIIFGCILGFWSNPLVEENPAWQAKTTHFWFAAAIIAATFVPAPAFFRETLRYTIQGLALFVMFSYILQDRPWTSKILSLPFVRKIGLYSYTIYLIHFAMLYAVGNFTSSVIIQALFAAIASFLFAAAMYALVERPLAGLRHRLNTPQSTGGAAI